MEVRIEGIGIADSLLKTISLSLLTSHITNLIQGGI